MKLLHRLRLRRDHGSALLEAAVALGLLAVLLLGFAYTTVGSQKNQRTAVDHDIAVQAAQGVVEQARSLSWQKVSLKGSQPVTKEGDEDPGVWEPTGGLQETSTVTVRELPVTLTTTVTWGDGHQHVSGKHPYGSKVVTVTATWTEGSAGKQAAVQKALLTPGVGEIPPAGIQEVK